MKLARPLIFGAPLILSACWGLWNSPSPAEDAPAKGAEWIVMPKPTDDGDPRTTWVDDLVRPRLTRANGVTWECSPTKDALVVNLANIPIDCARVTAENKTRPGLACVDTHHLRIPLRGVLCTDETAGPWLSTFHLPEGFGLFARDDKGLRPLSPPLPRIVWDNPTPNAAQFAVPPLEDWLEASSARGAVSIGLRLSRMPGPFAADTLPRWLKRVQDHLNQLRAPKHLRIQATLADEGPSLEGLPPEKVPTIAIDIPYRDPLLAEACRYVRQWVRARQFLDDAGAVDTTREIRFDCWFGWGDDGVPPLSVVLAKLPLPVVIDDASHFPFRTVEDSLSPSLWQSLKAAR